MLDDSIYQLFPGNLLRVPFKVDLVTQIIRRVNAHTILDIGCGYGEIDHAILKRMPSLKFTCLDVDEKSVSKTRENLRGFNTTVHKVDFFKFKATQNWDFCMLNNVLEHLEKPIVALRKVSGLATHVFAVVPNANSLHRIIGTELGLIPNLRFLNESDLKIGHRRIYTLSSLLYHFKRAKLNIVDYGGICLKPLSDLQMLNWRKKTLKVLFDLGNKIPSSCAEIWVLGSIKMEK